MDAFRFDLRYAVRTLQTSPAFTFVAVVMLALGIGATTLVYGVVDAVVLRPLPCPAPDRIVLVVESHPQRGKMLVRPANYEDWRRRAPWLEQSGMAFDTSFVLTGESRHIGGALADDGFFETWGVLPQLGRGFLTEDYRRPRGRAARVPRGAVGHGTRGGERAAGRDAAGDCRTAVCVCSVNRFAGAPVHIGDHRHLHPVMRGSACLHGRGRVMGFESTERSPVDGDDAVAVNRRRRGDRRRMSVRMATLPISPCCRQLLARRIFTMRSVPGNFAICAQ
jgi:hypothetical protein